MSMSKELREQLEEMKKPKPNRAQRRKKQRSK
jgi:hypothetical protein